MFLSVLVLLIVERDCRYISQTPMAWSLYMFSSDSTNKWIPRICHNSNRGAMWKYDMLVSFRLCLKPITTCYMKLLTRVGNQRELNSKGKLPQSWGLLLEETGFFDLEKEFTLTLSCPGCPLGVLLVLGIHISPNNGPMDIIPSRKLSHQSILACSIM